MSINDLNFGKRLKEARLSSKRTLNDVSMSTGISRQTLINYEKGKGNPTVKNIKKLCELYEISPNYLFYGQDGNLDMKDHDAFKKKLYYLCSIDLDGDICYDSMNGVITFSNNKLKRSFSICHALMRLDRKETRLEIADKILQYIETAKE